MISGRAVLLEELIAVFVIVFPASLNIACASVNPRTRQAGPWIDLLQFLSNQRQVGKTKELEYLQFDSLPHRSLVRIFHRITG